MPSQIAGNGPYVVNSVLHNRAISEIDGIHIRDLPMSAAGLPCLPSGAALPPNILFKLHHDELLNQDAVMNEYSNRLQMLTNRVDKIERGGGIVTSNSNIHTPGSASTSGTQTHTLNDENSLANNTDFIAKVLDNILTNTNLSDIINQIEPLQKENESLRSLIHSQQTTLNELSTLVMKLLNGNLPKMKQGDISVDGNLNINYETIKDEFCNYVSGANTGETGETSQEVHKISLNHDDEDNKQDVEYMNQDESTEYEEYEHEHEQHDEISEVTEYQSNTAREV